MGIAYVNGRVVGDISPGTPHLYKVSPKDDEGWGGFGRQFSRWGNEGAGPQVLESGLLHYPPDTRRLETSWNFLALAGM